MARTPLEASIAVGGLLDALPVTADATTSRVVVDNDAVRVVLFSFDAGQELTEHTAAVPVVVQVLRGTVAFEVDGATHELAPGDVVYLAPRAPHALIAREPAHLSLTMVHVRDHPA